VIDDQKLVESQGNTVERDLLWGGRPQETLP
jgi:hypothetical protein